MCVLVLMNGGKRWMDGWLFWLVVRWLNDGRVDVVVCVYEMVENMCCGDVCSGTMRR